MVRRALLLFIVDFGWVSGSIYRIRRSMSPGKGVSNRRVEIIFVEWVGAWCVCHEGCVISRTEKFPVGGKRFLCGFHLYLDCINILLEMLCIFL